MKALAQFRPGDKCKLAALLLGKLALRDMVHYNGLGKPQLFDEGAMDEFIQKQVNEAL